MVQQNISSVIKKFYGVWKRSLRPENSVKENSQMTKLKSSTDDGEICRYRTKLEAYKIFIKQKEFEEYYTSSKKD